MRKGIPNLIGLQMFEASARHQSFTRAAEELAITQSAVCRQVAALEARLGVQLFVRSKRRIVLTEHGRRYAERIQSSLDRIERDTLELIATQGTGATLEIAVTPMFASAWLIPRLPLFRARHPDITVNLSIRNGRFLLEESSFDAAIHFSAAQWSNAEGFRLLPEGDLVPVSAPALVGAAAPLTPARLARLPLLHLATRPDAWRQWLQAAGLDAGVAAVKGPRYEQFSLLASAAVSGLGVALVARMLVQQELMSGQLVIACRRSLPGQLAYYVAHSAERPATAALQHFLAWLGEVAADAAASAADAPSGAA